MCVCVAGISFCSSGRKKVCCHSEVSVAQVEIILNKEDGKISRKKESVNLSDSGEPGVK